ncbi:hypothetical protein [Deinococcus rubellus]|uniref:hypothetical protein n=1 Tax=Deinococcus rubellus TaxID=1889240 RepID=UPI0031EF0E72
MTSERGWGGQRRGAGRKLGAAVRVSLSIPREVWAEIERRAVQEGVSPQQLSAAWLLEKAAEVAEVEK